MGARPDTSGLPENARILIIKTHAIGDLLMATPAIRDIRRSWPKAEITLLVGRWSAPVVRHNPDIDKLVEIEDRAFLRRDAWELAKLYARLVVKRYDAVFVFHPLPVVHLFARLLGIPRRYGVTQPQGSPHLTHGVAEDLDEGTYYPLNFQKVVALAGGTSGPPDIVALASEEDERAADALLASAGVAPGVGFILAAPGGSRNTKEDIAARRWPPQSFAALLARARAEHPGIGVLVTGGPNDAAETAAVARDVPGATDLTGKTTLPVLIALAGRARAIVCNDSSLLHIGLARGTPVITPFGPTGARQRLPARALAHSAQSALPCSPCYVGGRFPGCEIGFRCMTELTPDLLYARLHPVLKAGKDGPAV